MNSVKIGMYEFLSYDAGSNIEVFFSTARGGLNFNKSTDEGVENLNRLKEWFKAENVLYLSQVHGNTVYEYSGNDDIKGREGDGIITDKKNTIIGVFTADCVPVILADPDKKVVSAVHSGWKGTFSDIAGTAVDKMINDYGCRCENIKAFIGPHNRVCCYEVSNELVEKFEGNKIFEGVDIAEGRHLNLTKCIETELLRKGIEKNNIIDLGLCTYCEDKYEMFSYRHEGQQYGRLFSFVILK